MTRRHYVAIAKAFNAMLRDPSLDARTVRRVIDGLMPVFRWANSNFNQSRFIDACYEGIDQ